MIAFSKVTDEELSELCAKEIMGWDVQRKKTLHVYSKDKELIASNFSIKNPAHLQMIEDKLVEDFSYELEYQHEFNVWFAIFSDNCVNSGCDSKHKHRAVAIAALKAKGVGGE